MTDIIHPGAGIIYMKVGTHAQETLEDIIARKTREIEEAGYALWGYGGNTCHPQTMVQPFARSYRQQGQAIYLCMQEMNSNHFADPLRADQCSADGIHWDDIPAPINVLGSRFALVIESLRREEFDLSLAKTRVALGNQEGRPGNRYIQGRVDKACLEIAEGNLEPDDARIHIGLVAELRSPYAVFLRNKS